MATTLSEFYTGQGKALPSVQDRQQVASQAGIQNYIGTAQQNTQLLGYLQNQGNTAGSVPKPSVPPTIPAGVATGNVQPTDLPNKPVSTAPGTAINNANAYILSKTGVQSIDNANKDIANLMSSTLNNPRLAEKLAKSNELQKKADLFNEDYRQRAEAARTNPMLGAETLQSRLGALERERAFTAGTLAIEAAAANQDYTSLKSLLNDQMQIQLEPLKFNRDFAATMYQKTEDQKFQREMKKTDQEFQLKMKDLDQLNDLKMQAFKDKQITVAQLSKIKTMDDFANVTGKTMTDVTLLKYQAKNPKDPSGLIATLAKKESIKPSKEITDATAVIKAAQDLANLRPDGRFIGAGGFLIRTRTRGAEPIANRSAIEAINLKTQQWASGASLTEDQTKKVNKMTPQVGDTDRQIRNKLNALTNYMMSDVSGRLAAQGINFNPKQVDFYAKTTATDSTGSISGKIGEAYANGYSDEQIIESVKKTSPELAKQVDMALTQINPDTGQLYTKAEVTQFLIENY